jgi:hypothetical protein
MEHDEYVIRNAETFRQMNFAVRALHSYENRNTNGECHIFRFDDRYDDIHVHISVEPRDGTLIAIIEQTMRKPLDGPYSQDSN